ncbi:MAG: O-antigen ligase family protein, partial [Candidatus Fimenecus sp.]
GITFRNYIPYAEQNLPETYIVNNDSGKFPSMHNSFVDVLVSQGILGMILLLCFIASVLTVFFRYFFKAKGVEYRYNTFLLLCFLPVFVSMMFYSETFYMNTGGAFLFWSFLGFFMHSLNQTHAKLPFDKTNKE